MYIYIYTHPRSLLQSELDINRKRKGVGVTPHKNPEQRKRMSRAPSNEHEGGNASCLFRTFHPSTNKRGRKRTPSACIERRGPRTGLESVPEGAQHMLSLFNVPFLVFVYLYSLQVIHILFWL